MNQIYIWEFLFLGVSLVCLNSIFLVFALKKYLRPLERLFEMERALAVLKYDKLATRAARWKAHAKSREESYYEKLNNDLKKAELERENPEPKKKVLLRKRVESE